MKIWFLTGEFAPEFGGGIGTYVENCAKMLAKRGHEIIVIVRGNGRTKLETTEDGYKVYRFKQGGKNYYTFLGYENALAYQYYEEIKELIKMEGAPDVIETQEYNAYGQYLIQNKYTLDGVLQNIPIVVHLHTPAFETLRVNQSNKNANPSYWIGEMEKFCIKGADALLCPSEFLAKKLQYLVPDKKINVINLPFDIPEKELDKYKDIKAKNEKKTFLYFGRTEYRKGIVQALAGAKKLWDKGLDFKIKIIGGDTILEPTNRYIGESLKEKYEKYIKEDKLEMISSLPHYELIPHIKKADAVLIPSLYENFPNTCIYSMWLGKAMLVSKQGGQAEMVEKSGENGLIFDWDKEGDFENKLEELYKMSDEELNRLGENAKKRIFDLCNMDKNAQLREEFFERTIKEHNANKNKFPFIYEREKPEYKNIYEGEKGLISVVIPYYNLGETISETIFSIKKSNYKKYEIIIVNDGSTDKESVKELEEFENDPEIRIINIENKGLANARNVGAENAKGEFIAFLDADDKIEETFYDKAVKILNKYDNVSYVYSWVKYFEGNNGTWPTFNIHIPYLLCANMLAAFAVIRKNDFLNFGKNRIELEYGMEDYDSWVALANNGCLGVSIPEKLNFYRIRKNSMARQFNKNMRLYLYEIMSKNYKEMYSEYSEEIFMLLMANGAAFYWSNPTLPVYTQGELSNKNILFPDNERTEQFRRLYNSRLFRFGVKVFFKLRINKLFRI